MVGKNKTARFEVIIVPFGLHIWKSFTCGRCVGKHLLGRLVNKGLYRVGKHVQISRIWQLLFMPLMKLVLREKWITLHMVKSIHSKQMCTDVCNMRWCQVCKVPSIQISGRFPKHNVEKHFKDYRLILHVSPSAWVELLVTHQF